MSSDTPATPVANRHHPDGSYTPIAQPALPRTPTTRRNAPSIAKLTSTPAAKGIIGRQAASTRAEVDPYLAEDLRTSRVYLPFETFLKKVLNLPEDWESNVEFQRCLTALEGNNALRETLDTYLAACDADGVENTLYAPAESLYNEATSVMADTEGSDISSTIYAYRQDPKRVVGSRASSKGDRSPDLGGVLYALWLDSLNDLDRANREGPSPKFSWEQLLLFWEFKKDHDLVDQGVGAPTVLDKNGQDPRDPAVLIKAKKDLIVASTSSVTSTGATKRGSDSNKPVAKRQKGAPSSVASRSDITSTGSLESSRDLTFDDANDDRKTTAYQCANYALDFLSASDHSLGLLVCDEEIQLMYYDHSCIAISTPLNVRSSRRMFMVLQASLHKAQQAALRNRGIVGRLFPNPSPYLRNYAEYKKIAGKDLNNILSGQFIQLQDTDGEFLVKLGRIIDRQTGIIGRCTYIVDAECDRWPDRKLIVKITYSPSDRQSEATFVNRIREVVAEKDDASWVLNHIPTILHSHLLSRSHAQQNGRGIRLSSESRAWTTAFVAKLDAILVHLPVKGKQFVSKLRLRSKASNTYYDPESLNFFTRINGERELRNLTERYIFCTIAEVLHNIDDAENEKKEFKFVNLSDKFTAHNAVWQVYALEAAGNKGKIMFPIVQMGPWSFSHEDFINFVKTRPEVSDDRYNRVAEYRYDKTTNKLWALLYDVCSQPRSNVFAVTNYNYWSFGYFTEDRTEVDLSEPIEAPIDLIKDGGKTFVQGHGLQMLCRFCCGGSNIKIGSDFYANYNTTILDCATVTIGNRVLFGPNVSLYPATHGISVKERQTGLERAGEITIGDDCWIGGGANIQSGVTLGQGCTVGAGAVVTKSFPDWSVIVGNPARLIKVVPEEERGPGWNPSRAVAN